MKKSVMITIGIVIAIVVIVGVFFAVFNKEKTAITASNFYETMSKKGYMVQDATSEFSEYGYVAKVHLALSSDEGYQIEFYELIDTEYANNFYENNKAIFEASEGNNASKTTVNLKNHSKFTLSTDGKYKVLSRIDNTVIYANVDEQYKDTVKDLLKELGY